jgi:epoxyqueuosine reductase
VDLRRTIEGEAARHGFSDLRVARADASLHAARFDAMLDEGRHGEMEWLRESRDVRLDPRLHRPGARSVVVLAFRYGQAPPTDPGGLTGRVASYAWGRDYHNLLGLRLKHLAAALNARHPGLVVWHGVDSGPSWDRGWAEAAGLGYAGRNGMMVLPGDTSFYFVALLYLSAELAPDAPLGDHCGRCRRCVERCPTGALPGDGSLDARRCISYLTIEHRGEIARELWPLMGRWIFGCDDCQEVCPHVRADRHVPGLPADFRPRFAWVPLPALLQADDRAILDTFEGTPLRRAGPARLRRNAAIVLGNIGTPEARRALEGGRACARERGDRELEGVCVAGLVGA